MPVFAFILIAGIWAAFLLPSFLDTRRKTPTSTTRSFARSTALLASVSSSSGQELAARRRSQLRRQRALGVLGAGAVVTLVAAIWLQSTLWLGISIAFDVAIAAYITLLLYLRQQPRRRSTVVPMAPAAAYVDPDEQRHTVRVVAG